MRPSAALNSHRGSHKPPTVIKNAEIDGAVEQAPRVVVDLFAAYSLASEHGADKEEFAFPLDFSVRAHATYLEVLGVLRLTQVTVIAAWRWQVVVDRWRLVQALMRALGIVDRLKVIEGPLLSPAAAGGWRRRILVKRQVKAFMASILLGLPGRDAFRRNTSLDEFD